mgnify:CR=1 FL=1
MLEEGISLAELVRRMGCTRQVVDMLVDFLGNSKSEQVERALDL